MPSLQSHILSLYLRWHFKLRPVGDEAEFVRVARRVMNDPRRIPKRTPPDISLTEVDEEGARGEWVTPDGYADAPTILYFHGGGYVGGSAKTYRYTTFHLARLARARVFAAEYRLAPEHVFPCAVDDALAAYRYVTREVGAGKVVFVGDSAGGGLLLATMLAARAAGMALPSAGVCFSPFTDLAATGGSLDANERSCAMFYADTIRLAAPIYLGRADARNPLASPLYADLTGLPPLQIFASTTETLLDDSLRLVERAIRDGVRVNLRLWRNLPHVWPVFPEFLPEARAALRLAVEFIEKESAARTPAVTASCAERAGAT